MALTDPAMMNTRPLVVAVTNGPTRIPKICEPSPAGHVVPVVLLLIL